MDPFTEKLLERTRARRQNLQKKMTERPNAANKQMVKRPREPLADTNIVASEPLVDPVLHGSTRPTSSKRRCSGENVQPLDEENLNLLVSQSITSLLADPPREEKTPLGPASVQPSSILAKPHDSESVHVILSSDGLGTRNVEVVPASLDTYRNGENIIKDPLPSVTGMKSRLQKLAEQRKCWDGDGNSDVISEATLPYLLKKNTDVHTMSSETPLGRKGRLAHLAATIESWEDDISCVNTARHNDKEKSCEAVSKFVVRNATVSSTSKVGSAGHPVAVIAESCKSVPSSKLAHISVSKSAFQSVASSQITIHETAFQSSSKKEELSPSTSLLHNPQTNLMLSRDVCIAASPMKPGVHPKPDTDSLSVFYEKANGGGPSIKSFLDSFGEVCRKHPNQNSLGGGPLQGKNTSVTSSLNPNTRLVEERLGAAQISNTATACAIQRQKLERESELAQIRNAFKKSNNILKNADDAVEVMKCSDIKFDKAVENDIAPCEPQTEALKLPSEVTDKPAECTFSVAGQGLMLSPPASTSSPLKMLPCIGEESADNTQERQESVKEMEMIRDMSVNSAVINGLFGVLVQNEDSLNISSMSLLTPLVENVAAAVETPERKIVTSTPASSFIVKNGTPDIKQSNIIRTSSSDSVEASDEHRLPYSIDSYRSTRVKDTERPKVKQVIVRKENVSNRADEPTISNLFSIKEKIKILTNEINLQQTVIHQASQALNCCTDEEHGKGSQVEAEAERLLLLATEKREALKAELERLKGDPKGPKKQREAPETSNMSPSKGSITLQELRLPLKADFVCSVANKPDSTKHSFFLMIRAKAEKIVATPLASTHHGLSGDTLTFPSKFTMSDVSSDFEIDIEVYCLVQKHEMCSDKRKKPSKSKAITPKRFLAISKSVQTVVASPGGPNAVRTSNFGLVGSHKLSLASIGKNKFPLEKVPFLCPVEGHIYLKMQCEVGSKVEERGFLTMFEDVSGFGAWHRRWCVLSGYHISYWTYPDDEKHKNPIGCISLANCTSKQVEPANREFCARPNTFELITVRPQREDDKETLVSQCKNAICVTKNWLSADTKDERSLWIKKLNQILVDLRMWRPDALFRQM